MTRLYVVAFGVLLAAAAVLVSGVVPLKASAGHWAVTSWILDFAKRRSVATHAAGVAVPDLSSPALVALGARQYERGCRACHGAPGSPMPAVPAQMLPPPPDLRMQAARWRPRELFFIVMHGIKFTGMPAWPAPQRDDEVWPIVSFLTTLPGLSADDYHRLVRDGSGGGSSTPDITDAPARSVATCVVCHDTETTAALVPRLSAQRPEYLTQTLRAYASGARASGVMRPLATTLDEPTIQALAQHFAAASRGLQPSPADERLVAAGARLVRDGDASREIPACRGCHDDGPSAHPGYPRLQGQPAIYLERQLLLLAETARGGTVHVSLMREVARRLSIDERRAVATYYSAAAVEAMR